jgi:hypothetical protein
VDALPAYIDREAWDDYVAMRVRIKKPMTPRITRQKLALLAKFHAMGHDVNEVIDAATNGCWQDFYEPRKVQISDARPREVLERQAQEAEAARLAAYIARTTIRRVA